MSEIRFRVRGWQAIPLAFVIVAFLGWRVASARSSLSEELAGTIRLRIQSEYTSQALEDLEGVDVRTLSAETVDPRIRRVLDAANVEIVSMSARGTGPVVVRVELRVAGAPPPDGRGVRYYLARHATITGWRIVRETTALRYWLRLF